MTPKFYIPPPPPPNTHILLPLQVETPDFFLEHSRNSVKSTILFTLLTAIQFDGYLSGVNVPVYVTLSLCNANRMEP